MMGTRDVRFPVPEFNAFLDLDPEDYEIDGVTSCLERLQNDPHADLVPFAPYHEYRQCWVIECGRFLIVYSFDDVHLDIVIILVKEDYQTD
jgi:hypothetical protein